MNMNYRWNNLEHGQTAVLFALMIVGLIAFVGLAVDGGNVLNERRITQNAADSGALTGVHYMVGRDQPTETGLQEVVNTVIEANGIPDTDGIGGNATNTNIAIFYTDAEGTRLTELAQPCDDVPCSTAPDVPGSIPSPARGLEVVVQNQAETFLLGLIGRQNAAVGADAVATASGGNSDMPNLGDNALIAFGTCPSDDKPLHMSLYYSDVIGGIRSSSWFENDGSENHYHGQVYYGTGTDYIDVADIPGFYEPDPPGIPQPADPLTTDPFAALSSDGHLEVDDFRCGVGDIVTDPDLGSSFACYDLTSLAPSYDSEINYRLLTHNSPDGGAPYLDPDTGRLRDGVYYAGAFPFRFGWEPEDEMAEVGMVGQVTLVTNSTIKITERDVQLTGYMPANSAIPGLLMYSGYVSPDPCANFETDPQLVPINTTGNSGTVLPKVYHDADGNYVRHELGSLQYNGLIYAPGGRVATSGEGASYVGAIVAYSIRINGYYEFENDPEYECDGEDVPCRPGYEPRVSALFVHDSHLFVETEQRINLEH